MRAKTKKRSEMTEEELAKLRAYRARWARENRKKNPEKARTYSREYRARNIDKARENDRESYHKDGRGRAKSAKYRAAHREEYNARFAEMSRTDPEYRERKRLASKEWREENPERYNDGQKDLYQRKRVHIHDAYMMKKEKCVKYLGGECMDCGNDNLVVMAFHHKVPSRKSYELSNGIRTHTFDELVLELDKCELLCANCHTLKHATSAWR